MSFPFKFHPIPNFVFENVLFQYLLSQTATRFTQTIISSAV